jgi:hypothetical protein
MSLAPPGSNEYFNDIETTERRVIANTYEKNKIKRITTLYYNFFTKKHKNKLNKGQLTNASIKKMAYNQAVKNTARNGGKRNKRKTLKRRR